MIHRANRKFKKMLVKGVGLVSGINSKKYWDHRFSSNWEIQNGRTQSVLFASGFTLTQIAKTIDPGSILDFGCGLADSMPVLKMAFPKAELFFYDFSTIAMKKAKLNYSALAKAFELNEKKSFELVYSSNVIEHITDEQLPSFLSELISLSNKYVIIQAPFKEYLLDGSKISPANKSNETEHERTIDLDMLDNLKGSYPQFNWTYELKKIPVAWDKGDQIFFIGTKQ
jgi:hypothetical protein